MALHVFLYEAERPVASAFTRELSQDSTLCYGHTESAGWELSAHPAMFHNLLPRMLLRRKVISRIYHADVIPHIKRI